MKRLEDKLQREVVAYLRLVLPEKLFRVFAIPNGGGRSKIEAAIMKGTGTLAGIPDIQVLGPEGKVWFLECKIGKGRLSGPQADFYQFCISRGVPMVVVRCLDDVHAALVHWKLETREAA